MTTTAPRRWAARLPLRTRLVAGMVLLVAVGLAVAGSAAASALRSYQLARVDQQLLQAVSSPALHDDGDGDGGPRDRLPGELYEVVLSAAGAPVSATSSADRPRLPSPAVLQSRAQDPAPFTVAGVSGGTWRVVAVPGTGGGTVLLGADLGTVESTVHRLELLELGIGAAVLAGVSLVGRLLVRTSLRGLGEVEEAAAAVAAGQLDRRVPARDRRTELGSLAASFNGMVADVEAAMSAREQSEQRLRRFVADASHELRTPLTSIRGFAELYRQGAVREPADLTRILRRIEDEGTRMSRLVEDLLALARLDEQRPLEVGDVDLAVVAADCVHDARAVQPARPLALDIAEPVAAVGDQGRLHQVLANLLSNALQHTAPDTAVRVRVRRVGDDAVLEVSDDGPGMTAEVADRVFERFFRADASRTRASGGAGLGLSIVSSLVAAHGGRVELDTAPGRGATFRVLLPAAPAGLPARPLAAAAV